MENVLNCASGAVVVEFQASPPEQKGCSTATGRRSCSTPPPFTSAQTRAAPGHPA
ncbi:hypothetical protein KCP70_16895 [Salmonella enterica subsp. enterica]|nr:hypothetical protein KCP70_16895 [Salmonella enterica subsp. enterica]